MKSRRCRTGTSSAWLVASIWLTLTLCVAAGQQPAPPQTTQTPTFRSGVEITPIDVTVLDSDGKPIEDLKPAEFQVRVDGKPRRVVSADWVPLSRPQTSRPPEPPPEGYSSNENATTGRLMLIAVDQPNIRPERVMGVRTAVNAFIDHVPASDPIAAVGLGHAAASTPFTTDRDRVKKALALMAGQSQRGKTLELTKDAIVIPNVGLFPYVHPLSISSVESVEFDQGSLGTIDSVVHRECRIATPDGAVVRLDQAPPGSSFASGLSICQQDLGANAHTIASAELADRAQTILGIRALLEGLRQIDAPKTLVLVSEGFNMNDDLQSVRDITSLAAAARTSIYALKLDDQPFDVSTQGATSFGPGDRQVYAAGLDMLASASRGAMFNVMGDGSAAIARMERELSGYYLVGVESSASDTDGKVHPINLVVTRRAATLRSRPELAHAPIRSGSPSPIEAVTAALASPLPASGLALRVGTFSLRDPKSSKIQVAIHADVGSGYTGPKPVTLAYVITDAKGAIVENKVAEGRLGPPATWAPSPLVFTGGAMLDPGEYTLKFAVVEGDRVGSVEHHIHAALADAGPLKMSELMIGGPLDARAILGPTIGYDVKFGNVQGYIEAYGSSASLLTMKYEIAPGIDAPSLFGAVVPGRSAEGDRTVFSYTLPVKDLAPGRYYLRATLSAADSGTSITRVARGFNVATATPPAGMTPINANASGATAATARPIVLSVADDLFLRKFRREDASRRETLQRFRDTITPEGRRAFDEGTISFAVGDDKKAEESFKTALGAGLAGNDSTASLAYLGATYAASGRDPEAIGIWQIALIDDNTFPQIYEWMAGALIRTGSAEEARAMLEEGLTRWPGETRLAKPLALLYAKAGGSRQALQMLARYLTEHAEDNEALALGVEWMSETYSAGAVLAARDADVKLARAWADAYTKAGGPRADAIKQWMASLENAR